MKLYLNIQRNLFSKSSPANACFSTVREFLPLVPTLSFLPCHLIPWQGSKQIIPLFFLLSPIKDKQQCCLTSWPELFGVHNPDTYLQRRHQPINPACLQAVSTGQSRLQAGPRTRGTTGTKSLDNEQKEREAVYLPNRTAQQWTWHCSETAEPAPAELTPLERGGGFASTVSMR